jgi:tetratricopeptide (TPR) repeat protein
MSGRWPAYVAREAVLADLETAIAATPHALDTRFYRASFLRDHGRLDAAIDAFADILAAAPTHVETLVAYAAALAKRGRRLEAREHLASAVRQDPAHYVAIVSLANLLALDEPERAAALYADAIAIAPGREAAHRGACSLAAARGDHAGAAAHRAAGYRRGPFAPRAYYGDRAPIPALALVSTDGGNLAIETLLDPQRFAVHECFVEIYRDEPLPVHALIVNSIADADRAAAALPIAEHIVAGARGPVLNPPSSVAASGRVANAMRLRDLPDVVAPDAWYARDRAPEAFPVIVREPGVHMGRGMHRIDDRAAYERARVRDDAIAIDYVETRSTDGAWRKYRVMCLGGALFPLHLAIAHRWNVHYFSSAMWENAAYRAEEAAFLREPIGAIGARAWAALERICAVLALDYAGIDFSLDAEGRVVVFEANAAMAVLPPDRDERFAYRRAAAEEIERAIASLVRAETGRP